MDLLNDDLNSRAAQIQAPAVAATFKPAPAAAKTSAFNRERILDVRHYTDKLFSFRTSRDPAFRFENGQFAMIGLEVDGRPLLRAYSMASANYEDHLEFFSIKVPDGPLTSRLKDIKIGDELLVGRKPTGTLVLSNLRPGRRLYLLSTGTGLAPFASLIKDPDAYERFETVILVHGVRQIAELEFGTQTVLALRNDAFLGPYANEQLRYFTTVTREPFLNQGRITDLIESGRLAALLGMPELDPAEDRVMLCGNPAMLSELQVMLNERQFTEGNSTKPGSYVIERAFVER